MPAYKLRSFRTIFRLHLPSIPHDLLARAQGHAAQQHDFREARGDLKTRVAVMYEPIVDMNDDQLRRLYDAVSGLK